MAPEDFYGLYETAEIPPPDPGKPPQHPVLRALRDFFDYDDHFDEAGRLTARRAYYGLCSYLDHNVGRLLAALAEAGLEETTRIAYTSDHGEMLGRQGFWTKSVMYEDSVAVPLLLAGPEVPQGAVVETQASLIDLHPTILEAAGLAAPETAPPHARSLFDLAKGEAADRVVLSEYHDGGSITGFFMLRIENWKYVHYVGYPPQLFDLAADPGETRDLGQNPAYAEPRRRCEARLREILDPEAVDRRAFTDQQRKIEALGGTAALLAREDFNHTPLAAESRAG